MHPVLYDILAAKKRELNVNHRPPCTGCLNSFEARGFKEAVNRPGRLGIIAEIKICSPSAGVIRSNVDPVQIAVSYERAGVSVVSVVTEKEFFKGSAEFLSSVRGAVSIPILRKDFIIDESQIYESLELGADAVLLIAGILSRGRLERFLDLCRRLRIAALTEVHSEEEMEKAAFCGADIIGINNRNLATFEVSLETTVRLASRAPAGCCLISESGIRTTEDLRLVADAGVSAALVGTALMGSVDPGEAAGRLVQAGLTTRGGGKANVRR
jgi:indole-3-glycerol phosphate synthase